MTQPSIADLMTQWKQMTDTFMSTWGKSVEDIATSPEGQAASKELEKTYVATRANMAKAAREAWGPIVEAAGAVPLAEFQRLADQVHTILLRLDRIDDALTAIAEGSLQPSKPGKKRKKKS
ncbi:MAG TPA: hypothetical protein PJ994_04900 [Tepidiformaceae bacterium]|nr:hypothetical protein [Tepidiformaceae bacterium]HMO96731.1 hypothetical protein [Tepidiformaceae bacterium]